MAVVVSDKISLCSKNQLPENNPRAHMTGTVYKGGDINENMLGCVRVGVSDRTSLCSENQLPENGPGANMKTREGTSTVT